MEERLPRRLAAILYADVAGYSRLMGEDEDSTHHRLSEYLDLISSTVERHRGRVMHYAGDAVLAMFEAVVDALSGAVAIQNELQTQNQDLPDERKVQFRIGVNLGDVIEDRGDIYGDGVNVAARLESLAEPGGVCVSESVRTAVGNKLSLSYESMGEQHVKNIKEPVKAYRVLLDQEAETSGAEPKRRPNRLVIVAVLSTIAVVGGLLAWFKPWEPRVELASIEQMAFSLPDKPSIAVLPFANMSGDPEQEYFADGIAEDLMTDLSKISGLFVISRNSAFTYKGRTVKTRKVAEELGVRYILEGSVRRVGDQVRINVQLIDAVTDGHLWAERYDGALTDIFSLQDKITEKIITALAVQLSPSEEVALKAKGTSNADAYDAFLRGLREVNARRRYDTESIENAQREFQRAIELDPNYALGYAALGWASWLRFALVDIAAENSKTRAFELAKKSMLLGDNALAHRVLAKQYLAPDVWRGYGDVSIGSISHDLAEAELRKAVALEPNNADYLAELADTLVLAGKPREAAEVMKNAKRLNPNFPDWYRRPAGIADYLNEHYESAIGEFTAWYASEPVPRESAVWLCAAYAQAGDATKAREVFDAFQKPRPITTYWVQYFEGWYSFKKDKHRDLFLDGLRKAGVPAYRS